MRTVRWPKLGLGARIDSFLGEGITEDALCPLLTALFILAVVVRLLGYLPDPVIWERIW